MEKPKGDPGWVIPRARDCSLSVTLSTKSCEPQEWYYPRCEFILKKNVSPGSGNTTHSQAKHLSHTVLERAVHGVIDGVPVVLTRQLQERQ